jgi:hypothetical protein
MKVLPHPDRLKSLETPQIFRQSKKKISSRAIPLVRMCSEKRGAIFKNRNSSIELIFQAFFSPPRSPSSFHRIDFPRTSPQSSDSYITTTIIGHYQLRVIQFNFTNASRMNSSKSMEAEMKTRQRKEAPSDDFLSILIA